MAVKNDIDITIGGKTITLSGVESEDYLREVASYLNGKLREFADDDELSSYIIGTIAAGEPLMTPGRAVEAADARWLTGIDYEMQKERRAQILRLSAEEIREAADLVEEALAHANVTIVGSEAVLKNCGIGEEHILRLSEQETEEDR